MASALAALVSAAGAEAGAATAEAAGAEAGAGVSLPDWVPPQAAKNSASAVAAEVRSNINIPYGGDLVGKALIMP